MADVLSGLTRLITSRPYATLGILLVITVFLAAGAAQRVTPVGTDAFVPPESDIATALQVIDDHFGHSGDVSVVTLLFRGHALTPDGLAQVDVLLHDIADDASVQTVLISDEGIVGLTSLLKAELQVDGFESVTQSQINAARGVPQIEAALSELTGTDTDDTPVAITVIRLRDTSDELTHSAERRISELSAGSVGPLKASSVSPVVIQDEYQEATEGGTQPLIGLALLLIAVIVLLFTRSLIDLLLTLVGLVLSLVWIIGAEGWLGPGGLGAIGPPNALTAMVPIIVISLAVDYAIQAVSHYREQRAANVPVATAARIGLRIVMVPLSLAAITTMMSFLVGLLSPIPAIGDFGIVAALGVGLSLVVMLMLLPAGRAIVDRRRESRGSLPPPRPIANALPGIERAASAIGSSVTRRPVPYMVVITAVTIGLGIASTGIASEFSSTDLLPRGGRVLEDITTLDVAVGGSTEIVNVLLEAEVSDARTLLNLRELRLAFEDELRRPVAAAGPIQASYELLVDDWSTDSGEPGDRYDPELEELFGQASAGLQLDPVLMRLFQDKLAARDPSIVDILTDNPDGIDTLLVQFPAYEGDYQLTNEIQNEIEAIWSGADRTLTATSGSIIAVAVSDAITGRQTEAIATTIAVALGILIVFFWLTLRQPMLAFIAVGPIVLVLIWVLGTMALLGIPFTMVTSIITALSIGIGVDYTIHVIHRYREEFTRLRDPEKAAIRTLATTGSALLGSALTTAFGLGVLALSPLLASQHFGITAAITIGFALLVSILVVPLAMTVWGAYQNMRLRSSIERMWNELDVALDDADNRQK